MVEIHDFISTAKQFFRSVELHERNFKKWIKEAETPLQSITNQSLFYRATAPKNSVLNTPFENIEGFREALIENIFASLQEEYNLLNDIRKKINSANDNLLNKLVHLENLFVALKDCQTFKSSQNCYLSTSSPSYEHIVIWSRDIWCYYHSYYLQISQALLKLNYADENTVKSLTESFKEDKELKKNIDEIRSITLFKQ